MEFAALCLADFIDWRYSLVDIFDPVCVLLPIYILSDLLPPPPLPKLNVQYIQTVCVCGGGGC